MFHFLVIGIAIFALQALTSQPSARPAADSLERIVVTPGRIEQLAQIFTKTWQRPPTPAELRGLVDAFVKEEVYYREAVKLGLDRDDTLIRRRMQQKMEFMIEPDDAALTPTDAQLRAHLKAYRDAFRVGPKAAFQQIYINPDTEGQSDELRAERVLENLRNAPNGADFRDFGDQTLLPRQMALTPLEGIARRFGRAFADALRTLPRNEWVGPIPSPLGLHIVRITDYRKGYDPPLADIHKVVERSWRQARRQEYMQSEYERLKAKYDIVLPFDNRKADLE